MKSISGSLQAHLDGEVTTMAVRWKITRRDGTIMGFTSHVEDVEIGGLTYKAASGPIPSAIESSGDFAVDNLDVVSVLADDAITEEDLLAGLYNYAEIEIAEFNHQSPTMGEVILRRGTLGEVSVGDMHFRAEMRGAMQPLQQMRGRFYQKRCDADLGDSRCGVNVGALTQSGTVTSVSNRGSFLVSGLSGAATYFNHGKLTWTSGLNDGLEMEVKLWSVSPSGLDLFLPMPFNVQVGDTFTVTPGCDLTRETCRDVFSNIANFRGFPDIPTRDAVIAYPDSPA